MILARFDEDLHLAGLEGSSDPRHMVLGRGRWSTGGVDAKRGLLAEVGYDADLLETPQIPADDGEGQWGHSRGFETVPGKS